MTATAARAPTSLQARAAARALGLTRHALDAACSAGQLRPFVSAVQRHRRFYLTDLVAFARRAGLPSLPALERMARAAGLRVVTPGVLVVTQDPAVSAQAHETGRRTTVVPDVVGLVEAVLQGEPPEVVVLDEAVGRDSCPRACGWVRATLPAARLGVLCREDTRPAAWRDLADLASQKPASLAALVRQLLAAERRADP